ncbi:hypothetical protein [Mycolicibacterium thermoresistibile]
MTDIARLHRDLLTRICDSAATVPPDLRRAAFSNTVEDDPVRTLVEKVAFRSWTVTDEDVDAVRAAGLSEDQIFELVVCAAVGQATRQYRVAADALTIATGTR